MPEHLHDSAVIHSEYLFASAEKEAKPGGTRDKTDDEDPKESAFRSFVARTSATYVFHLINNATANKSQREEQSADGVIKKDEALVLAKRVVENVYALPNTRTMTVEELTRTIQDEAQKHVSVLFHTATPDRRG